MTNNASSTIRALDLDDLDNVVGGATAVASQAATDMSHDGGFLAAIQNVGAVAATAPVHAVDTAITSAAAAMAAGHETAAAAITSIETAAQTAHVSTDMALTALLNATHGSAAVATELTTRLASGAAATELVTLAATNHLAATDVHAIVGAATSALATFSADGHSALGLTQAAATAVIEGKISDAAHLLTSDQTVVAGLAAMEKSLAGVPGFAGAAAGIEQQIANLTAGDALLAKGLETANVAAFTTVFDTVASANVQLAHQIETVIGGQIQSVIAAAEDAPLAAAHISSQTITAAANMGQVMEAQAAAAAAVVQAAAQTALNAVKNAGNAAVSGLESVGNTIVSGIESI